MQTFFNFTILLLSFCFFGCESNTQTKPETLKLTMKRDTFKSPFRYQLLNIEGNGKVVFVLESNEVSDNEQKFEIQLSEEKMKSLVDEVTKSKFFSFDDDYSFNPKTCSTDQPSVILTIEFDEKEKTINHYQGCRVNSWFSKENALQPLIDLENKIDEIVETKRWIGKRK